VLWGEQVVGRRTPKLLLWLARAPFAPLRADAWGVVDLQDNYDTGFCREGESIGGALLRWLGFYVVWTVRCFVRYVLFFYVLVLGVAPLMALAWWLS
jgi:hypothetical protein